MIIGADIETQGLDATKFLMGSIYKENGVYKVFYDKEEMWEYILELGKKEMKRKKVLNVYSHNAQYDFYGYANITDPNITYYSHSPFIATYKIDGKETINFLDLMGIYRMSLKRVGEIIGVEKYETPKEFTEGRKLSKEELKKYEQYVTRDSEIAVKAIQQIKKKLDEEGIEIRRLFTINQIALAYLMNKLSKEEKYHKIFYDVKRRRLHWSKYPDATHSAYRGGRVEAFKTGYFEGITYIDANSLYGWASREIRFPDIKTEKMIYKPTYEQVKGKIGIMKTMMYNRIDDLGILQVRNNNINHFPREQKYMIGIWTIREIEEAMKNGYKIINTEWAVVYEEMENPFKEITSNLFERRNESGEFNKFFYKQMMNCSYGKLGQKRTGQEIKIDNVEEAENYDLKGYEVTERIGYNYIYRKKRGE